MRVHVGLSTGVLSLALACARSPEGDASEAGSTEGSDATDTTADADTATTDETSDSEETTGDLNPICEPSLRERVSVENVAADLAALHQIAVDNDGNRAAGTPGYEASAAYVEAELAAAGYTTSHYEFSFSRFMELSPTELEISEQPGLGDKVDFRVADHSPSGSAETAFEPIAVVLGLGNSSTSGCSAEDFAGFTAGRIALIQRGGCTFSTKLELAEAAGASAVIVFNQGDTAARLGLFSGTLEPGNGSGIPMVFTSYAVGETAVATYEAAIGGPAPTARVHVDAAVVDTPTFNVIAETPGGDPTRTIMLGAHLDSVPAGPGVNDNGSGTAMVLELARGLAECEPNHRVRFAWWGAEEWGLHGSREWVLSRTDEQLAELAFYLNFDMIASPNYVRFVHSGVGGPDGSGLLSDSFVDAFEAEGLQTVPLAFDGRSDYQAFVDAGVPAGGLATGAEATKSAEQSETFGGEPGEAFDACYHLACDDDDNYAVEVLGQNLDAAAVVLEQWATELGEFAATPEIVDAQLAAPDAHAHACGSPPE